MTGHPLDVKIPAEILVFMNKIQNELIDIFENISDEKGSYGAKMYFEGIERAIKWSYDNAKLFEEMSLNSLIDKAQEELLNMKTDENNEELKKRT